MVSSSSCEETWILSLLSLVAYSCLVSYILLLLESVTESRTYNEDWKIEATCIEARC
jgi:hypothetical protein